MIKKYKKNKSRKKENYFLPFSTLLKKAEETMKRHGTLKLGGMSFLASRLDLSSKKNVVLGFDGENFSFFPEFYGFFPEMMGFLKDVNKETGCLVKFEEEFVGKLKSALPPECADRAVSVCWNYLADTDQL